MHWVGPLLVGMGFVDSHIALRGTCFHKPVLIERRLVRYHQRLLSMILGIPVVPGVGSRGEKCLQPWISVVHLPQLVDVLIHADGGDELVYTPRLISLRPVDLDLPRQEFACLSILPSY
jgi:hypothetical protein